MIDDKNEKNETMHKKQINYICYNIVQIDLLFSLQGPGCQAFPM
jgi:hypothetical protein